MAIRWQAARWGGSWPAIGPVSGPPFGPGPLMGTARSSGSRSPHAASACAQRVRKRPPEGGSIGLGGSPTIGAAAVRRRGSMLGIEASSARV